MVYRVNSDNSGRATGVAYYGPDGSENTIEADLVILAPFTYDNTRLLLLSKTAKFPDGLANSSGWVGKGFMTHLRARVQVAFDNEFVNVYMGPSARSIRSTTSIPTISIMAAWASSAARKSRSVRLRWKVAPSARPP
jgi:choline dehydrogenase-like flavoprotein